MDGDFLTMLSFIMLAQAQECFYEKVRQNLNKKHKKYSKFIFFLSFRLKEVE